MNRCCVALLTPGKGAAAASILVSAEIRPLGLRVNWTEVASARYSRWRDTAICTALAASGAMIATTISTTIRMPRAAVALLVAVAAAADAAPLQGAQDHVGDQRDQADRDADDRHVARVEIGDMGHLVGDHALQLVAIERVQQAARHDDRGIVRRGAGGEGIERVGLHHQQPRHRHARGDRHLLDDVEELRRVFLGDRLRVGHRQHHAAAEGERDQAPADAGRPPSPPPRPGPPG